MTLWLDNVAGEADNQITRMEGKLTDMTRTVKEGCLGEGEGDMTQSEGSEKLS